jgi:hypothetical protein
MTVSSTVTVTGTNPNTLAPYLVMVPIRLAYTEVFESDAVTEEHNDDRTRYISLLPAPDVMYNYLKLRQSDIFAAALIDQYLESIVSNVILHIDRVMGIPLRVIRLTGPRDFITGVEEDLEQLCPDSNWVSDVSYIFRSFVFRWVAWTPNRIDQYLSEPYLISADAIAQFLRKYRGHFDNACLTYDIDNGTFDLQFVTQDGMTAYVNLAHVMKQIPDAHLYVNKPLLDLNAEGTTSTERTMVSTSKPIKFVPINREVMERLATRYSFRVCEECAAALEVPDNWLHLAFYSPNGHIYPARITSTITPSGTSYFIDPTREDRTVCGLEQSITGVTSILVVASHQMVLDAYYYQKKGHPLLKVLGQNRDVLGKDLTFSLIPEDSMLNAMTLAALTDNGQE